MAKTGAAGINAHILLTTTSLADCIKLVRKDGIVQGFTNHDVDIVFDGVTYEANSSIDRSNAEITDDLKITNLELIGLLSSTSITNEAIRAGLYDNAELYFFTINHQNTSDGIIKLQRGFIGEIRLENNIYIAELRGLSQKLSKNLLKVFTPECDADFGDSTTGCGFDLDTVVESGTVGTVTDNREFTLTGLSTSTEDFFNQGKLIWLSGLNTGLTMEVKDFDNPNSVKLFLKMPFTVGIGDTCNIWPGCKKDLIQCSIYDQVVNFRGFPYIPGTDELISYPDAQA